MRRTALSSLVAACCLSFVWSLSAFAHQPWCDSDGTDYTCPSDDLRAGGLHFHDLPLLRRLVSRFHHRPACAFVPTRVVPPQPGPDINFKNVRVGGQLVPPVVTVKGQLVPPEVQLKMPAELTLNVKGGLTIPEKIRHSVEGKLVPEKMTVAGRLVPDKLNVTGIPDRLTVDHEGTVRHDHGSVTIKHEHRGSVTVNHTGVAAAPAQNDISLSR